MTCNNSMAAKALFVVAAAAFAGCAPVVRQMHTADGRIGHSISCPFGDWSECFQKAGELCGVAGYDVQEKSDDRSQQSSWGMYGGSSGTINQRVMVVACKRAGKS